MRVPRVSPANRACASATTAPIATPAAPARAIRRRARACAGRAAANPASAARWVVCAGDCHPPAPTVILPGGHSPRPPPPSRFARCGLASLAFLTRACFACSLDAGLVVRLTDMAVGLSQPIDPDLGVDPEAALLILSGAFGAVVLLAFVILALSRFLCICRPNEILVISGRRHR